MKKIFLFFIAAIFSVSCTAGVDENKFGTPIKEETESFLGVPYVLSPLGEGSNSDVDKDPLWRFDAFDCMTYVETVIAMHNSKNQKEFEETMNNIRYMNGKISFGWRNHFTELDWIRNNSKYVKDITSSFKEAKLKEFQINRSAWVWKHLKVPEICTKGGVKCKLESYDAPYGNNVRISYIPKGKITKEFLNQLPDNVVINIARWNEEKNKKQGFDIFIYHMGFLIDNKDFYHASSTQKKVVKVDFFEYIANQPKDFVGINILEIK